MHYIFLISFSTTKFFNFQIYYSNAHSLKEIIMIIKDYHIITIDITQTINNTLNPNGPKWTKWTDLNQTNLSGLNGLNWTQVDRTGPNSPKWTE